METLNKAIPEDEQNIVIRHSSSNSPNSVGANIYIDKDDGSEFDEDSLDMLERGHLYQYVEKKNGDRSVVFIHTPYRTFDEETLVLCKGLSSLRAEQPLKRFHPSLSRNKASVGSILKDFSINYDDWITFKSRVESLGGKLEDSSTSLEEVQEAQQAFSDALQKTSESLSTVLSHIANMSSNEDYLLGCKELEIFRDSRAVLQEAQVSLLRKMANLSGAKESTLSSAVVSATKKLMEVDIGFTLFQLNEAKEVKLNGKKPDKHHLGTLQAELGRLKTYFPQLNSIRVDKEGDKEVVKVVLVGLTLKLTELGVSAEGDPTAMYRYTGQQKPQTGDMELYSDQRTVGVYTLGLDEDTPQEEND